MGFLSLETKNGKIQQITWFYDNYVKYNLDKLQRNYDVWTKLWSSQKSCWNIFLFKAYSTKVFVAPKVIQLTQKHKKNKSDDSDCQNQKSWEKRKIQVTRWVGDINWTRQTRRATRTTRGRRMRRRRGSDPKGCASGKTPLKSSTVAHWPCNHAGKTEWNNWFIYDVEPNLAPI